MLILVKPKSLKWQKAEEFKYRKFEYPLTTRFTQFLIFKNIITNT